MEKESQNKQILEHLKRGLSIAPMEALRKFNCMRLGARIHNLRESYPIITRMIKLPSGKWIARYRMIHLNSIVLYGDDIYNVTRISDFPPFVVDISNKIENHKVGIDELS